MSPATPMPATTRTSDQALTSEDRRRIAIRIYLVAERLAPDAPTRTVDALVAAAIDAVLDQLAARERRRPTVTPTFSNPAGPPSGRVAPFRGPVRPVEARTPQDPYPSEGRPGKPGSYTDAGGRK